MTEEGMDKKIVSHLESFIEEQEENERCESYYDDFDEESAIMGALASGDGDLIGY
jgi:hypothetical protein